MGQQDSEIITTYFKEKFPTVGETWAPHVERLLPQTLDFIHDCDHNNMHTIDETLRTNINNRAVNSDDNPVKDNLNGLFSGIEFFLGSSFSYQFSSRKYNPDSPYSIHSFTFLQMPSLSNSRKRQVYLQYYEGSHHWELHFDEEHILDDGQKNLRRCTLQIDGVGENPSHNFASPSKIIDEKTIDMPTGIARKHKGGAAGPTREKWSMEIESSSLCEKYYSIHGPKVKLRTARLFKNPPSYDKWEYIPVNEERRWLLYDYENKLGKHDREVWNQITLPTQLSEIMPVDRELEQALLVATRKYLDEKKVSYDIDGGEGDEFLDHTFGPDDAEHWYRYDLDNEAYQAMLSAKKVINRMIKEESAKRNIDESEPFLFEVTRPIGQSPVPIGPQCIFAVFPIEKINSPKLAPSIQQPALMIYSLHGEDDRLIVVDVSGNVYFLRNNAEDYKSEDGKMDGEAQKDTIRAARRVIQDIVQSFHQETTVDDTRRRISYFVAPYTSNTIRLREQINKLNSYKYSTNLVNPPGSIGMDHPERN